MTTAPPWRLRPSPALATALSLALLLLWDAVGLDLPITTSFASAQGFSLREHWLLTRVLHDGARLLAFALVLWVLLSIWKPLGVLRRLERRERIWLLAVTAGGMLLISVLKRFTLTSCPWDLQQFGGAARYLSHWAWGQRDGGPGHCFPAGHASAALAWVAGYFAFRGRDGRIAWTWLALALAAGVVLGLSQQLRGAHYASHTLWTAWLCWTWAWLWSGLLRRGRA